MVASPTARFGINKILNCVLTCEDNRVIKVTANHDPTSEEREREVTQGGVTARPSSYSWKFKGGTERGGLSSFKYWIFIITLKHVLFKGDTCVTLCNLSHWSEGGGTRGEGTTICGMSAAPGSDLCCMRYFFWFMKQPCKNSFVSWNSWVLRVLPMATELAIGQALVWPSVKQGY